VDGAATWGLASNGISDAYIYALAIAPQAPFVLYAGTRHGAFKSVDGAESWSPSGSGLTGAPGEDVRAPVIDLLRPDTLYAGTYGYGQAVFKSMDGGAHWSPANTGLGSTWVRALAIDPRTPTTLYAGTDQGVFKSVEGAATWSLANTGLNLWGLSALAIDPQTPTTLYAGTKAGLFIGRTVSLRAWLPLVGGH
jgi:hypothetical protein